MGLLDEFSEFAKTPAGQGLLAATFGGLAGATKGAPINSLGRAGLAGMAGYSGAIDRQKQLEEAEQNKRLRDMQMSQTQLQLDAAKSAEEKRKWMEELAKKYATRQTPAIQGDALLPDDLKSGILPSQGSPAGFNFKGYASELASRDPMESLKWEQMLQKDDTPQVIAPGATLVGGRASGYKPLFSAPAKPDTDAKIQQYEYAKGKGYKGTFEQFIAIAPTIMAAAQAPLRAAQTEDIRLENDYKLPPKPAAASGGVTVTAGGKTFTFPDQKSANNFKLKAGIK